MKVHHLNCGSMQLPNAPLVCHVLLLETDNGLVLVDSGYGLDDIADPRRRLGPVHHLLRPALDPDETAARQVEGLGFTRDDVRHIVITHFDSDHIGGLSDFPHAKVHTTAAEVLGSIVAPSWREKIRYRRPQWAHGLQIVEHTPDGEPWRGFAAAKELDEVAAGIVLVSLPGHTRGHAAVAVDAGDRWLLHAGDAFYHPGTLDRRRRAVLAHNIIRWTDQLGGARHGDQLTVARTVRAHLINLPGRLVNRSGRPTLRLPAHWPWATTFSAALERIRSLPQVT